MIIYETLVPGRLVKRYKRFIADIQLKSGEVVTAHCPNSGSMRGLVAAGNPVFLWRSDNPRRKLQYTWEFVRADGTWVGINTMRPHRLLSEALENGLLPELEGFVQRKDEVRVGNSRLDVRLSNNHRTCYLELKNVTLVEGGRALFPDAVTSRGARHLDELMNLVKQGERAAACFVIQREDAEVFSPAVHIDPYFSEKLKIAAQLGVEIFAIRAHVKPPEIRVEKRVPVEL